MTRELQSIQSGAAALTHTNDASSTLEPAHSRTRRRPLLLVGLAVLIGAGALIWRSVAPPAVPADRVALSGRIEADEAMVAPKLSGRILEVRVREGDSVKAGEVIAILDDEQVRAREDQAQAAVAQAEARARAQLAEARANRTDLTIRAPFDGTIVTRSAEPGEIVGAGTAIATLVDLSRVYLRGFVPEGRIGAVKVGQPARVYIDSHPDDAIAASVSRIDPQATFTPENTYFREDRVKQVVGVKLQLEGAFGLAKPGMPADGEILVSGGAWTKSAR